mgnify:CR=1 FL=1
MTVNRKRIKSRPAAVLIFLVLGTIMMGLATPTEAGAMGTIGAIVLAVVRNAPLTKFDRITFGAGCAAAIIGALIGTVAFKSLPFQIAFTVMFAAIIWLCWRAWPTSRATPRSAPGWRAPAAAASAAASGLADVGAPAPSLGRGGTEVGLGVSVAGRRLRGMTGA